MFGSAGAGNFLSRTTAILATIFFIISLVIGNINSHRNNVQQGQFDDLSQVAEQMQQTGCTQQIIKIAIFLNKNRLLLALRWWNW